MIQELLKQIGETPPQDMLANAQMRAAMEKHKAEQRSTMQGLSVVKGRVRRR